MTELPDGEALALSGAVTRFHLRASALDAVVGCIWITNVPASAAVVRVLPDAQLISRPT